MADDSSENFTTAELTNLNSHMSIIGAISAKNSYNVSGSGIKIGMYDIGSPNDTNVIVRPDPNGSYNTTHANMVYTIMQKVAPDATYYAAIKDIDTTSESSFYEGIEWLLDQGVNIINMSYGFTDSIYRNKYDEIACWIDHISFNHHVHFIQAAGNSGTTGIASPGMAYNIITVGCTSMTSPYERYIGNSVTDASSYYKNATSRVNQLTHKPDVCAPGVYNSTIREEGLWGTSFSTPLVAGSVALILEYRPTLKTQAHSMKAILAATTGATAGTLTGLCRYATDDTKFKEEGAGIINVKAAIDLLSNYGYSTGSISNTSPVTFNLTVTSSGETTRVALAYLNRVYFTSTTHENESPTLSNYKIAELKLEIKDPNGNLLSNLTCDTDGANLKVIEFEPTTTGKYQIIVTQTTSSTQYNSTSFAIANNNYFMSS